MSARRRLVTGGAVAVIALALSAGAALAQEDTPDGFEDWDANGDGNLQGREWEAMDREQRDALRAWLDDLGDDEAREWVESHVALSVKEELDLPADSIVDQVSEGVGTRVGNEVEETAGQAREAAGNAASEVVGAVSNSAFDAVAARIGEAASDLTSYLGEEMARTGRPQLQAAWYQAHYERMLGWSGILLLPLAFLAIGTAVVRGDTAQVGQTLLQVPIVYLLGILAISAVSAASGLATAMASSLVPGMEGAADDLATRVTALTLGTGGAAVNPGVLFVLGLLIAIAALVTLLWLLLAEAAIYATVLFVPLAFAGRVWEPARDWGRKLLTIAFALVGAKVVVFAVWALAVDGLAASSAGDAPLRSALALAALLVMTAVSPSAALRFAPMLEGGANIAGSPGQAARSALSGAYYGSGVARMAGLGRSGASRGPGLSAGGNVAGAAPRAPGGADGRGQWSSLGGTPRPASLSSQPPRPGAGGEGRGRGGPSRGRPEPRQGAGSPRDHNQGSAHRGGESRGTSTGKQSADPLSPSGGAAGGAGAQVTRPRSPGQQPRVVPPAPPPGSGGDGRIWRRRDR